MAAVPQIPNSWPADLLRFVERTWGEPRAIEPLSGLSGAKVWLLTTAQGWAVVKHCGPAEASFYQTAAPPLRAVGVGIPELWWSGERDAADWLLLEYLPAAPLRAAWLANQGWMRTLARLHQLPLDVFAELGTLYRPSWGEAITEAALELVAQHQRRALRAHLQAIAAATEQLQRDARPISGDPNPRNWGLRSDGGTVLFDWERAGIGPRAFDLAITIPGLASVEAAQQVARAYLIAAGAARPTSEEIDALARDLVRCKVWVVAEFMATVVEQGLALEPSYTALWQAVPDWAVQVARLER